MGKTPQVQNETLHSKQLYILKMVFCFQNHTHKPSFE